MSWWKRILSGEGETVRPQRLDYLNEGLALERQGDYEGAITAYHLALRDHPLNVKILQYIAIALSRTGRRGRSAITVARSSSSRIFQARTTAWRFSCSSVAIPTEPASISTPSSRSRRATPRCHAGWSMHAKRS